MDIISLLACFCVWLTSSSLSGLEHILYVACFMFQGQSPHSLPSLNEELPTKAQGEGTARGSVSGESSVHNK